MHVIWVQDCKLLKQPEIELVGLQCITFAMYFTQTTMNTPVTTTVHLLLFLILLTVQLHNSCGAPRERRRNRPPNNTTALPSSPTPVNPCNKLVVNISVSRDGCSDGTIEVPTCSGACNSYVHYVATNPHKESQCSCCQATTYKIAKRTVSFKCAGGSTQSVTFSVAVADVCACSRCGTVPTPLQT